MEKGADRSLGPGSPIRVGLIGFGFVSKIFHIPLLKATDGYIISAVSSSRPGDVKAVLPDVEVISDPRALAADPDVLRLTGRALASRDLADQYGFTDVDGSLPDGPLQHRPRSA